MAGDVARLQDTERSLQAELNRVSAANQSVRVRAGNGSHLAASVLRSWAPRTEPPVAVWHVGLQAKHADAEATIRELREDVQDAQKRAGTLQLDLDAVRTASKQREARLEAENAELAAQVDTIPQLQEFRKRAEVCGCGFACVVVCCCVSVRVPVVVAVAVAVVVVVDVWLCGYYNDSHDRMDAGACRHVRQRLKTVCDRPQHSPHRTQRQLRPRSLTS